MLKTFKHEKIYIGLFCHQYGVMQLSYHQVKSTVLLLQRKKIIKKKKWNYFLKWPLWEVAFPYSELLDIGLLDKMSFFYT
ncbi:hypothetical protein XENTR_v10021433 [Xenopus tropicalis]|nr:hypothetical protein XENTR_v10021433 [Xenopus tropicalis]